MKGKNRKHGLYLFFIVYLFPVFFTVNCALAQGPSFDCAKASTRVEKMICGNEEFSELDRELNASYIKALKSTDISGHVKNIQRKWVERRDLCKDYNCLRAIYQRQINLLKNLQKDFDGQIRICKKIKKEIRKKEKEIVGESGLTYIIYGIDKYKVEPIRNSLGNVYKVDIDEDGITDFLEKSCSASILTPADKCYLDVKLSTKEYDLLWWGMKLVHYEGEYYVILWDDDKKRNELYSVSKDNKNEIIFNKDIFESIKWKLFLLKYDETHLLCDNL